MFWHAGDHEEVLPLQDPPNNRVLLQQNIPHLHVGVGQ
jgi:hypothetical protein